MSKPLRDVWAETLVELGATNPDILVMDADLGTSTKADKFAAAYPDRFLQMGIAEQGMVGTAAGLSFCGYVPWLSSFGIFFTNRALDQVRMALAQTHANVKIGAAYTGLLAGLAGKTHVDISDLAVMRAMPGMTVLAPVDAAETAAMTRWATATPGPVYLRLSREAGPDVFGPDYVFEPGRVIRLREGRDVLLISTGMQTSRTLAAAELLAADGCSALGAPRALDQALRRGGHRRDRRRRRHRGHGGGAHGDRWARRARGRDPGHASAAAHGPDRHRGHVGRIGAQRVAARAARAHAGAHRGASAPGVEDGVMPRSRASRVTDYTLCWQRRAGLEHQLRDSPVPPRPGTRSDATGCRARDGEVEQAQH